MATGDRWTAVRQAVEKLPDGTRIGLTAIDLDSGERFAHGGGETFRAASTIKALILATMARAIDAGTLDLDRKVILPESLRVGGSGVITGLSEGLTLPLRDYAWLMITISDNTASNVCIEAVGMDAVNETAAILGLPTIHLGRYFTGMAAKPGDPENLASSDDLAGLMAAIVRGEVAGPEPTAWMVKVLGDQQFLDRLPGQIPAGSTWLGKTGSLERIFHDAGVFSGPNGRIAVSCLSEGFEDALSANAAIAPIGAAVAGLVIENRSA